MALPSHRSPESACEDIGRARRMSPQSIPVSLSPIRQEGPLNEADRLLLETGIDDNDGVAHVNYNPDDDQVSRQAVIRHFDYTMADGYGHKVIESKPRPGHKRSDTAIGIITPWFISAEGGYIFDLVQRLGKHGHHVIAVGAEGSAPTKGVPFKRQLGRLFSIDLETTGANFNRIMNHRIARSESRPDKRIGTGSSRGWMGGMALRQLAFADYMGGCFPQSDEGDGLVKVGLQVPREGLRLGESVLSLSVGKMINYGTGTLPTHPRALAHQVMTWSTLKSGKAGEITANSDPTVPSIFTLFEEDDASKIDVWEHDKLVGRTDTILEIVEGAHLTIPLEQMTASTVIRMDTLAELRGIDGDFAKVDFDAVRTAHHDILGKRLLRVQRIGDLSLAEAA